MRMRRSRMLPLLLLAAATLLPAAADAQKLQKPARLLPYHELFVPGADAAATDAALRGALVAALARPQNTSGVRAQTSYVPYYNKNLVRYDRFDWHI